MLPNKEAPNGKILGMILRLQGVSYCLVIQVLLNAVMEVFIRKIHISRESPRSLSDTGWSISKGDGRLRIRSFPISSLVFFCYWS